MIGQHKTTLEMKHVFNKWVFTVNLSISIENSNTLELLNVGFIHAFQEHWTKVCQQFLLPSGS